MSNGVQIQGLGGSAPRQTTRQTRPAPSDRREFAGLSADQQGIYEQQFADVDRLRSDLDAERARSGTAYGSAYSGMEGARDTAMHGARVSSMMPVYAMQSGQGLAGAYSGGGAQAASQASMGAATRSSELGATYAERLGQMEMDRAGEIATYDNRASQIEAEKTRLEQEAFTKVDEQVQTDIDGIRKANWMDMNYVEQLLLKARDLPEGSRARAAFIAAARDAAQMDTMTQGWLMTPSAAWAATILQEAGGVGTGRARAAIRNVGGLAAPMTMGAIQAGQSGWEAFKNLVRRD